MYDTHLVENRGLRVAEEAVAHRTHDRMFVMSSALERGALNCMTLTMGQLCTTV